VTGFNFCLAKSCCLLFFFVVLIFSKSISELKVYAEFLDLRYELEYIFCKFCFLLDILAVYIPAGLARARGGPRPDGFADS
jgi:hypothetical protein